MKHSPRFFSFFQTLPLAFCQNYYAAKPVSWKSHNRVHWSMLETAYRRRNSKGVRMRLDFLSTTLRRMLRKILFSTPRRVVRVETTFDSGKFRSVESDLLFRVLLKSAAAGQTPLPPLFADAKCGEQAV
jgi:hypothetical protein